MSDPLGHAASRVAQGDPTAFRQVVELTSARLYRLAARLLGSTAEAEDALQDSYLKAYQALCDGQFDGGATVTTWLYRIVTNGCLDALRRRRLRPLPTADPPSGAYDGSVSTDARLALAELDRWLSELPGDQRAVLVLRFVEELSSAEVAAIMDCSEGAVEQRLVRARATLRKRGRPDDE